MSTESHGRNTGGIFQVQSQKFLGVQKLTKAAIRVVLS
jgi:hypothetical protein